MERSKKTVLIILGVGLALALGVAAFSSGETLAANILQATAQPTAQAPQTGAAPTTSKNTQYQNLFLSNLASQLGTTVDKLKAAIVAAVGATADQAVQDKNLTQSQADNAKSQAQNWANNGQGGIPFLQGGKHGGGFGKGFGRGFGFGKGFFDTAELAKALNMTQADVTTALQAGKSIATIAEEHNLDLNTVKQTLLNDYKANLQAQVTNNKLTQTQADQIYQKFSQNIDQMLQATPGKFFRGPHTEEQEQTTPNTITQ